MKFCLARHCSEHTVGYGFYYNDLYFKLEPLVIVLEEEEED